MLSESYKERIQKEMVEVALMKELLGMMDELSRITDKAAERNIDEAPCMDENECCSICPEYEECLEYDSIWDMHLDEFDDYEECSNECDEEGELLVGRDKSGPDTIDAVIVPAIKDVLFNEPATIVYWANGDKTVVKTQAGEKFDKEKGLAMAILKYYGGNDSSYFKVFRKYCGPESDFRLFE